MAERAAFVTGASSGFGLGVVLGLRVRGWKVYAGLRDAANAPAELKAEGIHIVQCDVSDEAQALRAAEGIVQLDCLVNNAGYGLNGPLASYSSVQMRRQFEVNMIAPALLVQTFLPALAQARGVVINVSSILGESGMPMNSLYCASKFALEGFSEALYHELKPHGVRVALVEPGGYRTRFGRAVVNGEKPLAVESVAALQMQDLTAMRRQLLAGAGRDPAPVIAAILRIVEKRNPPLRTRVGAETHAASLLKRWLPQRLWLALMGRMFERRMPLAIRKMSANEQQ